MKKHEKFIYRTIITLVVIAIPVAIIMIPAFLLGNTLGRPDQSRIERIFYRDKEDLVLIVNYFVETGRSSIHFRRADLHPSSQELRRITDDKVIEALTRLFNQRNYDVIVKDGNTIHFQVWSSLRIGVGIAYSINKYDEPILDFLTHIEPLSVSGWYFYEENYIEWRHQNR